MACSKSFSSSNVSDRSLLLGAGDCCRSLFWKSVESFESSEHRYPTVDREQLIGKEDWDDGVSILDPCGWNELLGEAACEVE